MAGAVIGGRFCFVVVGRIRVLWAFNSHGAIHVVVKYRSSDGL